MAMKFYTAVEVSDGMYEATVTGAQELSNKWKVDLQPSQGETIFKSVTHWSDSNYCDTTSDTYQLFAALGNKKDVVTIEEFRSKYVGKKVGIIISDNYSKDGTLYHNIRQFFNLDEWNDVASEYDEESLEEMEEDEDELEEDDGEEELPFPPAAKSKSKSKSKSSGKHRR